MPKGYLIAIPQHTLECLEDLILQTLLSDKAYQFLVDFILRTKNQLNDGFD